MVKTKGVSYFVAVSDLAKPVAEQEGFLVQVDNRSGDTEKNRAKALDIVNQMWEEGNIESDKFPDGVTKEHIFFVPPDSPQLRSPKALNQEPEVLPVVQGAQEIIELTKLQVEVQEAAEETAPYAPIIEAILDRSRPLTPEEKDLAKEKKYGKVINRMGFAIASQEDYQANCTGNGRLILNAIAWQLNREDGELGS